MGAGDCTHSMPLNDDAGSRSYVVDIYSTDPGCKFWVQINVGLNDLRDRTARYVAELGSNLIVKKIFVLGESWKPLDPEIAIMKQAHGRDALRSAANMRENHANYAETSALTLEIVIDNDLIEKELFRGWVLVDPSTPRPLPTFGPGEKNVAITGSDGKKKSVDEVTLPDEHPPALHSILYAYVPVGLCTIERGNVHRPFDSDEDSECTQTIE